jgi:hypothetical protein
MRKGFPTRVERHSFSQERLLDYESDQLKGRSHEVNKKNVPTLSSAAKILRFQNLTAKGAGEPAFGYSLRCV